MQEFVAGYMYKYNPVSSEIKVSIIIGKAAASETQPRQQLHRVIFIFTFIVYAIIIIRINNAPFNAIFPYINFFFHANCFERKKYSVWQT